MAIEVNFEQVRRSMARISDELDIIEKAINKSAVTATDADADMKETFDPIHNLSIVLGNEVKEFRKAADARDVINGFIDRYRKTIENAQNSGSRLARAARR